MREEREGGGQQEKLWFCHLMSHGGLAQLRKGNMPGNINHGKFCDFLSHPHTSSSKCLRGFTRASFALLQRQIIVYCSC